MGKRFRWVKNVLLLAFFTLPPIASAANADMWSEVKSGKKSCKKVMEDITFPFLGKTKQQYFSLVISDILGNFANAYGNTLTSYYIQAETKSAKGGFEAFMFGREVNPIAENIYFLAKKNNIREIIKADIDMLGDLSGGGFEPTSGGGHLESLGAGSVSEYSYPISERQAGKEKIKTITWCSIQLALLGEDSEITTELKKYSERLNRKIRYENSNKIMESLKAFEQYQ